ncbi:amidase family protein [Metamycoplasma hyosynoviae]|uniref:amidase family protein n=1 Tax=Metamycoplasma hyosynoviae TaxID=29559 RepID=UPI00235F43AE|nr:amidase family protein [Metamycoplasma hyosynoviae]MDD1371333.1 amidase family protein [Metamycoplasma hyosynoviae]MDD1378104.1 amidase family protein [Metamycoplasma hyosynoviae]
MIIKGDIKKAIKELKSDKNNAVAYVFENAKLQDKGILSNCVFTIKDNYAQKNVECKASSLFLNNFKPQYNATVINLLEQAGATCIARTNLDEFGLGGSGEYSAYGKVLHPQNKKYLVGGSSSGAAATFNENISFAIGSDTGDSVRKPASNIGKCGFKPSYGAVSRYGLFAFATSLDTVAYFTHNVSDLITLSSVLYKQDLKSDLTSKELSFEASSIKEQKPKTVCYLDCFDQLEDYVASSYQKFLDTLVAKGINLIKIKVNEKLLKSIDTVYRIIAFSEASSNLSNLVAINFGMKQEGKNWEEIMINSRSKNLGKMVQSRLILGSYFLEQENQSKYFNQAKKMRRYLSNYFTKIHEQCDIFVFPASNASAPEDGKAYKSSYMDYILTYGNLVGNPSLTLKLGENPKNHMPFNISIDAKLYSDTKLMEYALFIEKILGELYE